MSELIEVSMADKKMEWGDHFRHSMESCHLPVPPANFYISATMALAHARAMVAALRVAVAAKDAMTLKVLIQTARQTSLRTVLKAAAFDELLIIAGGVVAAGYVGAVVGAIIYATEKTHLNWTDQLIDYLTAQNDADTLAAEVARLGVPVPGNKPMLANAGRPVNTVAIDCVTGTLPSSAGKGWPVSKTLV